MTANRPRIGATAMVFGFNMQENLIKLAQNVNHVELLLYWTPQAHNFPTPNEADALKALADRLGLSLSVHLPAMLNLITGSAAERQSNLELLTNLIHNMERLNPTAYVLHLGPNPPRLSVRPRQYLPATACRNLNDWYAKGFKVLEYLQSHANLGQRLLLENLDFSPLLLKPFLEPKLAGLCLDIGHMWLGREALPPVMEALEECMGEIHLHGVLNNVEHISLKLTPPNQLQEMAQALRRLKFAGVINLEVFSPEDFYASLAILKASLL